MPVGMKDRCECCGSKKDVSLYQSKVAYFTLYLCKFCAEGGHEPKWILDVTIEEAGGAEFCPPHIRDLYRNNKYCVIPENEED